MSTLFTQNTIAMTLLTPEVLYSLTNEIVADGVYCLNIKVCAYKDAAPSAGSMVSTSGMYKVVSGVVTQIDTYVPPAAADYTVDLVINGSAVEIQVETTASDTVLWHLKSDLIKLV